MRYYKPTYDITYCDLFIDKILDDLILTSYTGYIIYYYLCLMYLYVVIDDGVYHIPLMNGTIYVNILSRNKSFGLRLDDITVSVYDLLYMCIFVDNRDQTSRQQICETKNFWVMSVIGILLINHGFPLHFASIS